MCSLLYFTIRNNSTHLLCKHWNLLQELGLAVAILLVRSPETHHRSRLPRLLARVQLSGSYKDVQAHDESSGLQTTGLTTATSSHVVCLPPAAVVTLQYRTSSAELADLPASAMAFDCARSSSLRGSIPSPIDTRMLLRFIYQCVRSYGGSEQQQPRQIPSGSREFVGPPPPPSFARSNQRHCLSTRTHHHDVRNKVLVRLELARLQLAIGQVDKAICVPYADHPAVCAHARDVNALHHRVRHVSK